MDGPYAVSKRRLIHNFVLDRHSNTLLAKAFDQITGDQTQTLGCSPKGTEQSSRITQPQPQVLETCK